MAGFLSNFDLSSLDGTNGYRLISTVSTLESNSVSDAGDINGDGFADFIVGAFRVATTRPISNSNRSEYVRAGAAYVVFGHASGSAADIDLATLNGTNGFRIDGVAEGDALGVSVSSAGDVNGDGIADLLVGAWGSDRNGYASGASYVVFGKTGGFASGLTVSSLNGTNGFRLDGGSAYQLSGYSVSSAGDVNGDGFADLVVGEIGYRNAGGCSIIFGHASSFAPNIELSALNGTDGFRLSGEKPGDFCGRSVSTAGDINGDGFSDLIVGAPYSDPNGSLNFGGAYVVFGHASGFESNLDLSALNGINGFRLVGTGPNCGRSVSSAGDFNGDGLADFIIGSPGFSYLDQYGDPIPGQGGLGAAYIVFGRSGGFEASLDLAGLNGVNGFRITGAEESDGIGFSVSNAGDFNGDGFADLLIGAPYDNPHGQNTGAAYVVYGHASGLVSNLDLATLNGSNGFRLSGTVPLIPGVPGYYSGDKSGWSVSAAGDVNGDGCSDVLVGAREALVPFGRGAAYVILGRPNNISPIGSFSGLIEPPTEDRPFTVSTSNLLQGFTDADGDTLSVSGLAADHGVVTDNGNGTYTITPSRHYNGPMALSWSVLDGFGGAVAGLANLVIQPASFGVTVSGADRATGEDGNSATLSFYLDKAPAQAVTLTFSVSDSTEARVESNSLTFTPDNWDVPQTLTVVGVDDYDYDGAVTYNLTTTIITDDLSYRNLTIAALQLTNNDDTADTPITNYIGTSNADVFNGSNSNDLLYSGYGDDTISGGRGNDGIYGEQGNDALDGGDGQDTLYGSYGIDVLTGGDGNDRLYGEQDNDNLAGGAGDDYLDGGVGADSMSGGVGNDTYFVDDANDIINDLGATTDSDTVIVMATIAYRLASNIEDATINDGAGSAGLTGNALSNDLTGNSSNNRLDGGAGNDVLEGNAGNDSLVGGDGSDALKGGAGNDVISGGAGTDVADYRGSSAGLTINLATGKATGDGSDTLTSIENVVGGRSADVVTGSSAANALNGGAGNDTLTGGTGSDRFVFDTAISSSNRDTITDFVKGGDKLILDDDIFSKLGLGTTAGKVISSACYKVGAAAGDANDYLIYNPATDKLYYDFDGSGPRAALQIATITLAGATAPSYADFLLVV